MWNLMNDTKDTMGKNFDMISYNKVILDTGEAPFPILEARINKYIEDNK